MGDAALTGDWSIRAVSRAAGLSLGSVRNLMRAELGLLGRGPLGPTDALCVRVLAELGANRSTNRTSLDTRTAVLLDRDRVAIAVVRDAVGAGTLDANARLLVRNSDARLVRKDLDVLSALDAYPEDTIRLLPVGRWAAALGIASVGAAA